MGRRNFGNVLKIKGQYSGFVRFSWRGERYWRAGGPTAAIARGKLARLQLQLEGGTDLEVALHDIFGDTLGKGMTFREAVPLFMEYRVGRKRKPSTLHSDKYRFRMLNSGKWTDKALTDIKPEHLVRWADERHTDKTCGVTIDRDLNLGSALYKWAILHGYAKENPFKRVPRFNLKGREREVYLTAEECRALVAAASTTMRPILILALSTGMRRGEIISLTWRAVDLEARTVTIAADLAKNGSKRVIRMTDDLYKELVKLQAAAKVRAIGGDDAVFTRHNGRLNGTPISVGVLRHGMEVTLAACEGIPKEKKSRLRFHDLRHTAASLMAAGGTPIFDIAKVLGHKQITVTMRYAHFTPEAGKSAIEKLGAALAFSKMA